MPDQNNLIEREFRSYYAYTKRYAESKGLANLLSFLDYVTHIVEGDYAPLIGKNPDNNIYFAHFHHGLSVCRMLINLQPSVSVHEEDILLTSALGHVMPEAFYPENLYEEFDKRCHLDPLIYNTIQRLYHEEAISEAELTAYYQMIQSDWLTAFLKAADQSHLVEILYLYDAYSARSYIHETRNHVLPLCIFAKGHYVNLLAPFGILMKKLENHIIGAEMLFKHYEARENELLDEILLVMEDNAALSYRIASLQNRSN